MTSSIPTFPSEMIAPTGVPAGVPVPLTAAPNEVPDFAGLLAEAAPVAVPVSAPAVLPGGTVAPASEEMPADAAPPKTGSEAILAGSPVASPTWASTVRRFVPTPGGVEQAGEALPIPGSAAPDAPAVPTRAEQEEAMAMLVACLASQPVAAPMPTCEFAPVPGETALPDPAAEAGRPGGAGWMARPEDSPANRMEPSVPTDRPDAMFGAGLTAPRLGKTEPGLAWRAESPAGIRGDAPVAAGEDVSPSAMEFSFSRARPGMVAAERADLALRSENGALATSSRVPGQEALAAGDAVVIEAAVVRHDGVRLAQLTAAGVDGRGLPFPLAEKSAGAPAGAAVQSSSETGGAGKKLLSINKQEVADDMPVDGTSAANAGDDMNPRTHHSFVAPAQGPGWDVKPAETAVFSPGTPGGREAAELAAPRVISTVLEVIEAQEASKLRPVPAVHLRMQVGGETIGIKVELRDATVQTHFTAVSPELREALAREWQAARSESPAGAPRLQDPVFNANPDRGGAGSNGQDAASQQQSQARAGHFPWEQSAQPGSRRLRPAAVAAAASADPVVDARLLSAVA